jgi:hypothetical protein
MSEYPDWWVWPLAAAIAALFIWYFWHTGRTMLEFGATVVRTIQNWPQTRRAMVEAEARSPGGRYPFWYRAIRVLLVVLIVGLAGYIVYRGFH